MHLLIVSLLLFFAQSNTSYENSDWDVNVRNAPEFHASAGCSQFEVQPASGRVARGEEVFTLPAAQGLELSFIHYGAAFVEGTTRADIRVTACKAAGGRTERDAEAGLDRIEVQRKGTITAQGRGQWLVYFIVEAPANAHLKLTGEQGPMYVKDFTGTLTAVNSSGPLKLSNVDGKIDARVHQGPLGFSGHGGDVRLSTEGGPMKIAFGQNQWTRGRLTASSDGPIKLDVPENYKSAVELRLTGDAPVKCRHSACRANRTWDRMTLGSGEVKATITANGPAEINNRPTSDDED
jgi:hypothetical protein